MKYLILAGCLTILMAASCKKNKPKTESEKLPSITQTGANTFGCLINNVAYIPGGGGVFDKILLVIYDPTFEGGNLSIRAKKIANGKSTSITLNGDSINFTGTYPLLLHSKFNVVFSDQIDCNFHTYYDIPTSGVLNISKFDLINRIISGTFSFKISTPKCGLIEATDGRFDLKY
ncbi:MAG: hypothetical protein ABI168_04100 [Ginsengibacter sp.]